MNTGKKTDRLLAWCAVFIGILLIVIWLIPGRTRHSSAIEEGKAATIRRPTVGFRPKVETQAEASSLAQGHDPTARKRLEGAWEDIVRKAADEPVEKRGDRLWKRVGMARIKKLLEDPRVNSQNREQLTLLLENKEQLTHDLGMAVSSVGGARKKDELGKMRGVEDARIGKEIADLVGIEFAEKIANEWKGLPTKLYAVEFVGEAYIKGCALSTSQERMVDEAIERISGNTLGVQEDGPVDVETGLNQYDVLAIDEFRKILTPDQLEVVRDIRIENNVNRAARALRRAKAAEKKRLLRESEK